MCRHPTKSNCSDQRARDICDRYPSHFRRNRHSWFVCCDSDASRPTEISVAADNLVCSHAVCGGTAEKRTSGLAGVWKLDRSHDRVVGTGGFGGLDAALYRGLVASDI